MKSYHSEVSNIWPFFHEVSLNRFYTGFCWLGKLLQKETISKVFIIAAFVRLLGLWAKEGDWIVVFRLWELTKVWRFVGLSFVIELAWWNPTTVRVEVGVGRQLVWTWINTTFHKIPSSSKIALSAEYVLGINFLFRFAAIWLFQHTDSDCALPYFFSKVHLLSRRNYLIYWSMDWDSTFWR